MTSLQFHNHRSEHWVVVSGTGELSLDNKSLSLKHGQSAFIPIGSVHRVRNSGNEPLVLIETQYGEICSENDITRLSDQYGRETFDSANHV